MHADELAQLEAVVRELEPQRCLEWGCGGSTGFLLSLLPPSGQLVSIEHDKTWAERVRAEVADARLELLHVPPNKPAAEQGPTSAWAAAAEHDASLLKDYVDKPQGLFDFVFVDGRARRFCLLRGYSLLRPGGAMMLHDAQRQGYQDVLKKLGAQALTPWKQGQMAVIRKPSDAYPPQVSVWKPNATTVEWIKKTGVRRVAELGVYQGHTTLEIAKALDPFGPSATLDLFDFADVAVRVAEQARKVSSCTVRAHGNSYKIRDSYVWSLRNLLTIHSKPLWDYVYVDGAHTWGVDGFSFFLCDLLLEPGGYIDFDDYHWTIAGSAAIRGLPLTAECYTDEQMQTKQIADVCELLVRRKGYVPELDRKIYRKPT